MNNRSLQHCGFWAKAVALMLASLFLILLPDWGMNLRAQTSGVSLTPTVIDFGQVAVGTTSSPQTVTLTNNDPQLSIAVNSITATGNFSASGCPLSLPPSSSCNISLTFSPGTIGLQTGLLTVVVDTCSDGCIESLTTRLTGNGVALLVALDDTTATTASTPVTINVLANDTGTGLTVTQVSAPAHGSAAINGAAVTYTPAANFAGTDTFTYTLTDGFGQTATATVTVTVNPPGLNAVNDTATTAASTPVTINVLANDTGTGLTVTQVSA
ncbi:MAG: choice-of-anchor D domain-containing protein, partial [Candidatus Competibacteraceae bacterium]|nr:choice-of-anchor D domain-containing protein [Candidatus Competibacteraceae bacterium]